MTYTFGTFRFESGSLELTREGRAVRLEPQPARALALLLSRAGEVVTRDELRAAIWGEHTHVDYDRGLAYCASQIRTALGDSGENPAVPADAAEARVPLRRAGRHRARREPARRPRRSTAGGPGCRRHRRRGRPAWRGRDGLADGRRPPWRSPR